MIQGGLDNHGVLCFNNIMRKQRGQVSEEIIRIFVGLIGIVILLVVLLVPLRLKHRKSISSPNPLVKENSKIKGVHSEYDSNKTLSCLRQEDDGCKLVGKLLDSFGNLGEEGYVLTVSNRGVKWRNVNDLVSVTQEVKNYYPEVRGNYLLSDADTTFFGGTLTVEGSSQLVVEGKLYAHNLIVGNSEKNILGTTPASMPASGSLYWGDARLLTENDLAGLTIQSDANHTLNVTNSEEGTVTIGLNLDANNVWNGLQTFNNIAIEDADILFNSNTKFSVSGSLSLSDTFYFDMNNKGLGIGQIPDAALSIDGKNSIIKSVTSNTQTPVQLSSTLSNSRFFLWYPYKAALLAGNVSGNLNYNSAGNYSIRFGNNTNARGVASFVAGENNNINSNYSAGFGSRNVVDGTYALVTGYYNDVNSSYSLTFGYQNRNDSNYSIVGGYFSRALGNAAVAIGYRVSAEGSAVAFGRDTSASGFSFAAGYSSRATGSTSFSFGENNRAASNWSVSIGGTYAWAYARKSFVTGDHVMSDSYLESVFGRYNVTGESIGADWSDSYWRANEPLFVVGNGSDANNRSNALTILKNGNVGIGPYNPTHRLQVGTQGDGTNAIANSWQTYSDRRYKTNIQTISGALDKVLALKGVSFNWKKTGRKSIGFIAQDVREVLPEIVDEDAEGYLSVDYSRVVPVLVEAVKTQNSRIVKNSTSIFDVSKNIDVTKKFLAAEGDFVRLLKSIIQIRNKIVSFVKEVVFKGSVLFESMVRFKSNVVFPSNMAGYVVVNGGVGRIHVAFSKGFSRVPVVSLTPMEFISTSYYVTNVTTRGFDIVFEQPVEKSVKLSWMALQSDNPKTTVVYGRQRKTVKSSKEDTPVLEKDKETKSKNTEQGESESSEHKIKGSSGSQVDVPSEIRDDTKNEGGSPTENE